MPGGQPLAAMPTRSMDVFALRDAVVDEYRSFATSFTKIHAADIREQVGAIYAQSRYWPEPLIQINPNYRRTTSVKELVADGALDPLCAEIFRTDPTPDEPEGEPLSLYKHQQEAIALAAADESYVVTTGTGSGKSLCFFIPIVNAVLAERRAGEPPRTRAIVIYPMNALANSQLEELQKYVGKASGPEPVTYARYTGQESAEERQRIADNPPDILLTNFMMLELLMTRQESVDRTVIGNCEGLRFLVLDELHTYRGRQGADVALLVRRVRECLAPKGLQCIGTSATMASDGTLKEKKKVVAGVASKLFAADIPAANVIGETLDRRTDPTLEREHVLPLLGAAIDAGIPANISDEDLRRNALAVWVETTLGIAWSLTDTCWVRAKPLTVTQAVEQLVAHSGRTAGACEDALRELLLVSSVPESERLGSESANGRSFFAFRLHQFFSGAGHAYATLEPAGKRTVTVDGQQFLPAAPHKRLYPVHFCRTCGHEYHPVRYRQSEGERLFLARDIDDAAPASHDEEDLADIPDVATDSEVFGFLTPHGDDAGFTFEDHEEHYPEAWLQFNKAGEPKLKPYYRKARPESVVVHANGHIGAGLRAWFIPGRFRFCLRCGERQATSARDRNRLASLSAEGRSSATTVLVGSALRWMHGEQSGLEPEKRKLLGFTDNRQDAALQAGHFNDFLFVSLIRAGFLAALQEAGEQGIRSDELGAAQQRALGFDGSSAQVRAEWLSEPDLRGFNLEEAQATLRQVLAYRAWFDQRRGWRFTNPNLEELGFLRVDYLGLEDLAADEELFADAPAVLRDASPAARATVYRAVLDHLRKGMAIRSHVLDGTVIEQMLQKSHSRLRPPWGFGVDERPSKARWLMISPPTRKKTSLRDEELIARGGSRSALGRVLKESHLWEGRLAVRDLKSAEIDALITHLLQAGSKHGLISEEPTPFDNATGWRLNDACVRFVLGEPDEEPAPSKSENPFFRDFYSSLAGLLRSPEHPLFGFESREHTAQVDAERRKIREKRFRYGKKEADELVLEEKQLRDMGEANRFLPVLFCSPTMELGVDIAALNAVYLRNVPPTPANYAQRSGRAGRSGQAALVVTYCSSQSPHDQYFFRDPKAMVHGDVRPPVLDLANRDLVESHLQAIWLASTETPLSASISELLELAEPARPLKEEVVEPMKLPRVTAEATRRMRAVLRMIEGELTSDLAPWFTTSEGFADHIAQQALDRLAGAFGRWRELFAAAEEQRDAARRTMDNYSAPAQEKKAARSRHAQAMDQISLLQTGSSEHSSDFYTYRYLATEGFLPGYNFPRLPLMAFIPSTGDRRGRHTFLQRPRFLALSEFGPRSLIYHEGRSYRVVRALISLGKKETASPDVLLPTMRVRICGECGGGHFSDDDSLCHACERPLGDAEIVNHIYRIENVATLPTERITANDEERQRQGFELQTTFKWAQRDGTIDVRKGAAKDTVGDVVQLRYGPSATITRLNKGLRRRANRTQLGFKIDPVSGYWAKNEDEDSEAKDPTVNPRQPIVPCVQDRKNAMLLWPNDELAEGAHATFQHALLRGIEAIYQLEPGEVLVEPMPSRDVRNGCLLYESTEGGAGVLNRLVSEPGALAEVARRALAIMHFDVEEALPETAAQLEDVPGTECVAACYRCLMSYYNQPDHDDLDRRDLAVKDLLLRLARAATTDLGLAAATPMPAAETASAAGADPIAAGWAAFLASLELPPADAAPLAALDVVVPLVWRAHYVAASFEELPEAVEAAVRDKGFELLVLGKAEASWNKSAKDLAKMLGRV
jgi:superfamily II DNA/RNA helicase